MASGKRSIRLREISLPHLNLPDVLLDPALGFESLHDDAAEPGDQQSGADVERRQFPAKNPNQDHRRHLVDHRAGNQKREGHAERDAGLDEADEQRHRRAGAERRHRTERDREAACLPVGPAAHELPHLLGREHGAQQSHKIDHDHQQHEDLGHVHHEELNRRPSGTLRGEP